MRKLAIALLIACTTASAFAQGTVFFANRLSSSIFAKVTLPDGTTGLSGAAYSAQLFAGPIGTSDNALVAVGTFLPFRTGAAAGAWSGVDVAIATVAPGAAARLQVRAWEASGGTSYAAAQAAGVMTGISGAFDSLPLGGPNPPAPPLLSPNIVGNADPLNNMVGFSLVPEPSVIALGALGVVGLLLRRRKA